MVYIRRKKVKGIDYAYLVKSIWDQANRTSKQETVRYLGKASLITDAMIPIEYRNDPSIISFITRHSRVDIKKNNLLTKKLGQDLFEMLSAGDLNGVIKICDKYANLFGIMQFFDNLLKPIMYDIGKLWAEDKLDVATEHVAVNTANTLIKIINKKQLKFDTKNCNKGKIFICTPNGEQHNLACNILESILLSKGYKVFNASPSLPADSIIDSLRHYLPDATLISVTLEDNIQTTKNLVRKIRTKFPSLPILVGGLALNGTDKPLGFDTNNTTIIRNIVLTDSSSSYLMILIASGMFLWVVYGIIRSDPVIIGTNTTGFALNVTLLIMKLKYDKLQSSTIKTSIWKDVCTSFNSLSWEHICYREDHT